MWMIYGGNEAEVFNNPIFFVKQYIRQTEWMRASFQTA